MEPTVKGLQEVQRWNQRAIANLKPGGEFPRTIRDVVIQIQRAEISITHVDTATLKSSLRMSVNDKSGKTYIDPAAVNPVSRNKPSVYGVIENARGGDHAFAGRTVSEHVPRIVGLAIHRIGRSLT